jgi:hypothetical protein
VFNGEPEAVAALCCVNGLWCCCLWATAVCVLNGSACYGPVYVPLVYSCWLHFADAGQLHQNTLQTGGCTCMAAGMYTACSYQSQGRAPPLRSSFAPGCVWLQAWGQWVQAWDPACTCRPVSCKVTHLYVWPCQLPMAAQTVHVRCAV